MADEIESVNLAFKKFSEEGLYLIFSDQSRIAITRKKIDQFAAQFLNDPAKVPPSAKKAVDYENCLICPKRGTGEFCVALRPTLPFLEEIDRHVSFEKVVAVYKEKNNDILRVRSATMQQALQYVSILSLIRYCEMGQKCARYFLGVIPLTDGKKVAKRIYLNIYWNCHGDVSKTKEVIEKLAEDISVVSACQIKRLNTICKSDPFLNAFVITQVVTELASMMNDEQLKEIFDDFEKE